MFRCGCVYGMYFQLPIGVSSFFRCQVDKTVRLSASERWANREVLHGLTRLHLEASGQSQTVVIDR